MKKFAQKGFTLIELLVVIAIIGILAGILFVAIDPANQTNKANTAAVKSSLAGLPTAALIYWDDNSFSYGTGAKVGTAAATGTSFCGDASAKQVIEGSDATCNATGTAYAVSAAIEGGTYCVDSAGFRGEGKTATAGVCSL